MKMKPIRPNTTQMARVLKQPIGSGFLIFRATEESVGIVEFLIDAGRLTKPDGTRLTYTFDNGEMVEYEIEQVARNQELK